MWYWISRNLFIFFFCSMMRIPTLSWNIWKEVNCYHGSGRKRGFLRPRLPKLWKNSFLLSISCTTKALFIETLNLRYATKNIFWKIWSDLILLIYFQFFIEFTLYWWIWWGWTESGWFWLCLSETQRWEMSDANTLLHIAICRSRSLGSRIATNFLQCQRVQRKLWSLESWCHTGKCWQFHVIFSFFLDQFFNWFFFS